MLLIKAHIRIIHKAVIKSCLCLVFASCTEINSGKYSNYDTAGSSRIRIIIDDKESDSIDVYQQFYMELMTPKDTFLVRPVANQKLQFPKLNDSLTSVNMYYGDYFALSVSGAQLKQQYRNLYFPDNDTAVLVIDFYPFSYEAYSFKHPRTKPSRALSKNDIYFDLSFKNHYVYGLAEKSKPANQGEIQIGKYTIMSTTPVSD